MDGAGSLKILTQTLESCPQNTNRLLGINKLAHLETEVFMIKQDRYKMLRETTL
jgi:hypothetical protein